MVTSPLDNRIEAIIPMVIDVLRCEKFIQYHYESYGFWAPTIKPFKDFNILERFRTPGFQKLMTIEDPYLCKDEIQIPKLIINASGDEFFLPDYSKNYFSDLLGANYLRILPNSGHYLPTSGSDAYDRLESFFHALVVKNKFPQFSWTKNSDGSLTIKSHEKPKKVLLWYAENQNARDFRMTSIGKTFHSKKLDHLKDDNQSYKADLKNPEKGFVAFFIELTYSNKDGKDLIFTTEISILPDIMPFSGQTPCKNKPIPKALEGD